MEKKQLNLNAPLLSVRKSGPIMGCSSDKVNKKMVDKSPRIRQQSLPVKNCEWELSEVTKPVAVPFLWEMIPGRAKDEGDSQAETPKRSSSAPRLPPGRVTDLRRNSGERPVDQNTCKSQRRNSGERPTDQNTYKTQWRKSGERTIDQNGYNSLSQVYPPNDHAALLESLKESIYGNGESDQESVDDSYSDVDTLSPAESLSLNCSVSGLSSSEFPVINPSGTFHVDQQTRDFMISRFLPAAKAMIIETPQYVPRKQSVSAEQTKLPLVAEVTKQVKKVTTDERKPLLDQCKSNLVLSNTQYIEDFKSEDDNDECDNHGNDRERGRGKRLGKAWGFFPRLCVKKTLCLLKPVSAMKPKTQVPRSPGIDVSRLTRKAYSGPLDKPAWDPSNKKRFHSGGLSRELNRIETRVSETNQHSYSSASYKAGGLSPCGPYRSGGISPYRNSRPQSPFSRGTSFLGMPKEVENLSRPQSPFGKGTSFLGMPKEVENLSRPQSPFGKGTSFLGLPKEVENLTNQKCNSNNKNCSKCSDAPPSARAYKEEAVLSSNVAEKTLYIDSVYNVKPEKDFGSSEAAKLVKSSYRNLEILGRNRRKEDSPANSRVQEVVTSLDKINRGTKPEKPYLLRNRNEDAKIDHSINHEQPRLNYMNDQPEVQTDAASADTLLSPQPPPLPKSPSESWLWRTVPSIHLHNPFSLLQRGNHQHSKKLDHKSSTNGTKWETIVKTSNVHHDDLGRFSQELSPHIAHKRDRR